MKAAVVTRYGPPEVIKVCEAPKPAPAADEVLVRVHATTVNRTDCGELRPGLLRLFYGLRRPQRSIFGFDFAGEVEAAGPDVVSLKPGDRVFGMCPLRRNGAHAEYVCVPESGAMALLPEGLAFEEAVVCEGAYYADAGLKEFHIGPGSKVMVYGASGAIGSAAVQLAKSYGADVTAVVPTRHLDMARSLGADRVVDYTAEDFTRIGERFDYLLDAVGKTSFFKCRKLLKPDGVFASTDMGPGGQNLPLMLWSIIARNNRVVVPLQRRGIAHAFVESLKNRMQAGQFHAVIDRRYPLDEIADAYRYVANGQKAGIVVINVVPARPAAPRT